MRVGEYRILFDLVEPSTIEIAAIKHRKEAY
jgi:mRNA-degrading endonuclease RelE of RelBE toxin-antitoxin system